MRITTLLVGLPLFALLAGVPAAFAAKAPADPVLPKIEATNIPEFDSVFMKAKTIQDSLDTQDATLKEARTGVNKALGVADDAPLSTALSALKSAAAGKVTVDMGGATPRLKPAAGVSPDVQKGCDAVNKLLDASEKTVGTAKDLAPQAKDLATAAAAFPGKLPNMGLDPMVLMKATKPVGNDAKATAATPDRIDRLVKTCEGIFTDVQSAFAS